MNMPANNNRTIEAKIQDIISILQNLSIRRTNLWLIHAITIMVGRPHYSAHRTTTVLTGPPTAGDRAAEDRAFLIEVLSDTRVRFDAAITMPYRPIFIGQCCFRLLITRGR